MAALSRSEPTPNHGFVRQLPATLTLAPSLTLTLTLTLALAPTLTLALTLALTLTRKLWMRALGWEVVICCDGLPAVRQRSSYHPTCDGLPAVPSTLPSYHHTCDGCPRCARRRGLSTYYALRTTSATHYMPGARAAAHDVT